MRTATANVSVLTIYTPALTDMRTTTANVSVLTINTHAHTDMRTAITNVSILTIYTHALTDMRTAISNVSILTIYTHAHTDMRMRSGIDLGLDYRVEEPSSDEDDVSFFKSFFAFEIRNPNDSAQMMSHFTLPSILVSDSQSYARRESVISYIIFFGTECRSQDVVDR